MSTTALTSQYQNLMEITVRYLSRVPGIGGVYDYRPVLDPAIDPDGFISLCTFPREALDRPPDKKKINAWFVHRRSSGERQGNAAQNWRDFEIEIDGYWSDKQAQGMREFQILVEDVCTEFRNHPDAELAEAHGASLSEPLQVQEVNVVTLANRYVVCHCRLTWSVSQIVTYGN